MDAKTLEEGKALLEAGAKSGDWPGELSVWLWTHKDELIADAGIAQLVRDKFKSGNEISIDRITIRADELAAIAAGENSCGWESRPCFSSAMASCEGMDHRELFKEHDACESTSTAKS